MPTLTSFDFNSLCVLGHLSVVDIFGLLCLCLFFFLKEIDVQDCLQIWCSEKGRVCSG